MLLFKGAKVYIATVDNEKAQEAIDELKADTGKDPAFLLHLDLANLDSIKEAVDEFRKEESQLHTLYNNE
jgi:NAD(P)-dependent dehydrogenase (short-subunit alcohol dehydrogenase family)